METGDDQVSTKRRALWRRDPATIAEALEYLRTRPCGRHWWVLEGTTYPDVVIQTKGALIVIEGKRTEAGPTTYTTWMRTRHQMLRHMDAAWEVRGDRSVLGFFIVEGVGATEEVPCAWRDSARHTLSAEAVDGSLPHRSPQDRAELAHGFLGVTTWQALCREFSDLGLDAGSLPTKAEAT